MPLFQYEALSEKGKKIAGRVDAETLREAKVKLIRQGIALIEIAPLSEKEMRVGLSQQEILTFTREVGRLLQAGLPLFEAISALEEKYRKEKFHPLLIQVRDQIKSGGSFSKALSHNRSFDLLYIAMVSNAEKTGRLGKAMEELSDLLGKQMKIRKQLISALIYPALLMTFCFVVFSSLLFFVIPSLKELFEGKSLHPFTQIVFYASDLAIGGKGVFLLLLLSLLSLSFFAWFLPSWRKRANALILKIPFLKTFFAKVAMVRSFRAVATLLEGGLPLIVSLEQGRSVMRHPSLEAFIEKAEEKIRQGESLSKSFTGHPLIPPLIPRMLSIAQESGKLSFTFGQIAQIYEEELEMTLLNFTAVAQPALLLFLGALVGFVLLSVLLPLTDVSSFVN